MMFECDDDSEFNEYCKSLCKFSATCITLSVIVSAVVYYM